ncbi:hypothetical protein PIB30_010612 [Stylosanthes scabra]|uniref:Uncharacterized protein n=1 Tax=Stylosanthes scabra TaxID=79078 RepID=A0ABU6T5G2_9FABA|nr:hypothetical protein [Stylosanthes scabra]
MGARTWARPMFSTQVAKTSDLSKTSRAPPTCSMGRPPLTANSVGPTPSTGLRGVQIRLPEEKTDPTRPMRNDPIWRAQQGYEETRSFLDNRKGTCSHARLRNLRLHTAHLHHYRYTRAYKYPIFTQVLPLPVSLKIHRLDSLRQPKFGADWAHQVLHSPRNIGAVAGDRSYES